MDFNDPAQAAEIQKIVKEGVSSQFWQLILLKLDERLGRLKDLFDSEEFDNLSSDEYRLAHTATRVTKQEIKNMKELPELIFNSVSAAPEQTQRATDPYSTAKDFLPTEETE